MHRSYFDVCSYPELELHQRTASRTFTVSHLHQPTSSTYHRVDPTYSTPSSGGSLRDLEKLGTDLGFFPDRIPQKTMYAPPEPEPTTRKYPVEATNPKLKAILGIDPGLTDA